MTQYEVYAEHKDGWEYLGDCPTESMMLMAGLHSKSTDTRLMFLDPQVYVPQKSTYTGMIKNLISYDLEGIEHISLQSMFAHIPDIVIVATAATLKILKQENLDIVVLENL